MKSQPAQFAFSDGEQSPLMLASDLSRPAGSLPVKAATTLENFAVLTEGGIARRRGTQFLSARPVERMIPMLGDLVLFTSPPIIDPMNTPVSIRIRTLNIFDDDWRITVGTTVIHDPQQVNAFASRDETFTAAAHPSIVHGATVTIDHYDGAFTQWRLFNWEATITWQAGSPTVYTGGTDTGSQSSDVVPKYRSNGSFIIERP
jgi:hypothetical protein